VLRPAASVKSDSELAKAVGNLQRLGAGSRRGRAFEQVALRLAELRLSGAQLSEAAINRYLGPPDLHHDDGAGRTTAYLYDSAATDDAVLFVDYSASGMATEFSFGDAASNDLKHAAWQSYQGPGPIGSSTLPAPSAK
jgi:hypothetical protein